MPHSTRPTARGIFTEQLKRFPLTRVLLAHYEWPDIFEIYERARDLDRGRTARGIPSYKG